MLTSAKSETRRPRHLQFSNNRLSAKPDTDATSTTKARGYRWARSNLAPTDPFPTRHTADRKGAPETARFDLRQAGLLQFRAPFRQFRHFVPELGMGD